MNVPETEEKMDDNEIVLQDDRRGNNLFIIEKCCLEIKVVKLRVLGIDFFYKRVAAKQWKKNIGSLRHYRQRTKRGFQ